MGKKAKYNVDDEVFWTDPDEGISSGIYKVTIVHPDKVYTISNGSSEAEVFEWELS